MRIILFIIMFIGATGTTLSLWLLRDISKDIHTAMGLGVFAVMSLFVMGMSIWLLKKPDREMRDICCKGSPNNPYI